MSTIYRHHKSCSIQRSIFLTSNDTDLLQKDILLLINAMFAWFIVFFISVINYPFDIIHVPIYLNFCIWLKLIQFTLTVNVVTISMKKLKSEVSHFYVHLILQQLSNSLQVNWPISFSNSMLETHWLLTFSATVTSLEGVMNEVDRKSL